MDDAAEVQILEHGDGAGDQGEDGAVIAKYHQHHAAGDAGDDHGGAGDQAQQEQQDDGAEIHRQGLDGALRALQQGKTDADGQQHQEGNDLTHADAAAGGLFQILPQAEPQDGQSAQNEAHKGQAGGQHMVGQQILQQKAEAHDADDHADAQRNEQLHALLEVLEQAGDRADELVIDAHGHRHGTARHAGNDVGDTNDDTAQDIQYSIHKNMLSFLWEIFVRIRRAREDGGESAASDP